MKKTDDNRRFSNIMQFLVATAAKVAARPGVASTYDEDGVRYLKFGTPWVQGAMRIDAPQALEVEYIQQMMLWSLFMPSPKTICQLGLGAGALTKFCYQHYPEATIEVVEINPRVVEICREEFHLPPESSRLKIVVEDAEDYVAHPDNQGRHDILQVDLYDAQAAEPACGSQEFYRGCAAVLGEHGLMTVNLLCEFPGHHDHFRRMNQVFEAVAWLPEVHEGNKVAIAFKSAPVIDFEALYQRASEIEAQLALPARSWVDGLYIWMADAPFD